MYSGIKQITLFNNAVLTAKIMTRNGGGYVRIWKEVITAN
jgi:hypothetical protein